MYYANVVRHETLKLWISFANKLYWTWHSILVLLGPRPDVMSVHFCKKKLWTLQLMPFRNFYNQLVKIIKTFIFNIWSLFTRYLTLSVLVHPKMAHSFKNGTLIQKWQIHPKMANSSKSVTFIQKWHITPKMSNFSKSVTFIQNWHIAPIMSHSSKNGTFIQKCHIHPKMAHSSKIVTFIQK